MIKGIRLSAVLGLRSDVKQRTSHAMLPRSREGGGTLLLLLLLLSSGEGMQQASYEQQRYDGWYNNLAHPAWGTVDSHLVRKTPPSYADGVYMMSGGDRPSPRNLSQAFMRGLDGLPSLKNRTAMQTFFGQVCVQPILPGSVQIRSLILREIPKLAIISLISSFTILI